MGSFGKMGLSAKKSLFRSRPASISTDKSNLKKRPVQIFLALLYFDLAIIFFRFPYLNCLDRIAV
jgi:hypothetical protein